MKKMYLWEKTLGLAILIVGIWKQLRYTISKEKIKNS